MTQWNDRTRMFVGPNCALTEEYIRFMGYSIWEGWFQTPVKDLEPLYLGCPGTENCRGCVDCR